MAWRGVASREWPRGPSSTTFPTNRRKPTVRPAGRRPRQGVELRWGYSFPHHHAARLEDDFPRQLSTARAEEQEEQEEQEGIEVETGAGAKEREKEREKAKAKAKERAERRLRRI